MWTSEQIVRWIQEDEEQVGKMLVALLTKQTDHERHIERTKFRNFVGFSATDAPRLTVYAKRFQRRGHLTEKELFVARKRLVKYRKQLAEIANERTVETTRLN